MNAALEHYVSIERVQWANSARSNRPYDWSSEPADWYLQTLTASIYMTGFHATQVQHDFTLSDATSGPWLGLAMKDFLRY